MVLCYGDSLAHPSFVVPRVRVARAVSKRASRVGRIFCADLAGLSLSRGRLQ